MICGQRQFGPSERLSLASSSLRTFGIWLARGFGRISSGSSLTSRGHQLSVILGKVTSGTVRASLHRPLDPSTGSRGSW